MHAFAIFSVYLHRGGKSVAKSRKRIAFICTEKSGKLQRTTGDCEHVLSLVGIFPVELISGSHPISSKGVGCFFYLCTGFTRAFGRITARLAPSLFNLK